MHFIQLVDSICLLSNPPQTFHKLHPLYHPLRSSKSLTAALELLKRDKLNFFYLLPDGSRSSSYDPSALASFYSLEEANDYFPELLI